jgi:hypothetical protein
VARFLADADRRIEAFLSERRTRPVPGFVPSDFRRVHCAIRAVKEHHLAPGERFCEWGAGFGVAAGLAAFAGFEASGIEIDAELCAGARSLLADHGLAVPIAHGTFVPAGGEAFTDAAQELAWLEATGPCGYEELDLEVTELDVVFAYPWPGEEEAVVDLFEAFAADGALLVTYHGLEDVRLQRKCR